MSLSRANAVFERITGDDFEQVVFAHDKASGLRAIIAVHSTRLGPALGGARFHHYTSESAALDDALRLARAMTYKAAAAGLDLGGGKAVILGHPETDKTESLMRAFGRHVDALGGRYITAEDVGTDQADMDLLRRETPFVTGISPDLGGSGDPSPATAQGVLWAMRAVAERCWDSPSLAGRHVAIAGLGKVGRALAELLVAEHAALTVGDVIEARTTEAVETLGAASAPAEKIHTVECDIFAPCALGGALNRSTAAELRATAVVGAANNQIDEPSVLETLAAAGVLYAPDYVVNAGGLINIAGELGLGGWNASRAEAAVRRIYATTSQVLDLSSAMSISTAAAADRLALARIEAVGRVGDIRRTSPALAGR